MSIISRRELLKGAALSLGAGLLSACQPQVVEVTRVVKETVMVEGEAQVVEKVVKEQVEVEKEVTRVVKEVVEKASETHVLRVHWRLGNVRPHYKERMKDLEEMFPGVTVNSEEFPAGSAEFGPKIGALIAAGAAGDVVWSAIGSGSYQFFAANGALASLEDLIAADTSGFTLDDFMPRVVSGMRYGPNGQGSGDLYAIPEVAHGTYQCLYFNKDLLEEAGLPTPPKDDSWTREDLLEIAIKATDKDARRFGFLPITGGYSEIRHTTRAYDGELLSPDGKTSGIESEGVKFGIRWLHDCFFKLGVAPVPAEQTGGSNQMFLGGRLAMFQSGTWGIGSTTSLVQDRFNWDMVLMPKGPTGERGGHLHADGFAVLKDSQQKELGYEFCKLLTSKQSLKQNVIETGGLTARLDTFLIPEVQEQQPFWNEINTSIVEAGEHLGPANLRKQESQTLIRSLYTPLWVGDEEPDDAWFAKVSQEWQDFLDKAE